MNKDVKIFACVVFGILLILAVGYITMLLWNWLVPALFSGPVITFWQALGLLILSKILFWGFGGKHHHNHGNHAWKRGIYEKFSNMSPEDREAFKQKMKDKWCQWEERKRSSENN